MKDSDIKRSFSVIEDNKLRVIHCQMWIPLDPVIESSDAWSAFGEFAKIQAPAEDVLELMRDFIVKAKSHG